MNNVNHNIACTVSTCAYHNKDQNYCTLDAIRVGCTAKDPTDCASTECASFQKCGHGKCGQ